MLLQRKPTREELITECETIRHSLRRSDITYATQNLEKLIGDINTLSTDLSHTIERGLRGVIDFFLTQLTRSSMLTRDHTVRYIVDSLLNFYTKHIVMTIQSQNITTSLRSVVFSLRQVFLILRHPPQKQQRTYAKYNDKIIALWTTIITVFTAPSSTYPEALLEVLGDNLEELYRLSLSAKDLEEVFINIEFAHISAATGTERKAKTKFFIAVSRYRNTQFTNAMALTLSALEPSLQRNDELFEVLRINCGKALALIAESPEKYSVLDDLPAEELKRTDFEGVLRFFSELHSVTHSKTIYVEPNYFMLYFVVIWVGLHVTQITSVTVNAVECFCTYAPTLFKSSLPPQRICCLVIELIKVFNKNNVPKRNERLFSASKTTINIISLLLQLRFDLFAELLHSHHDEIITFITAVRCISTDTKTRNKTEPIAFLSSLMTAIFNQPSSQHSTYFDALGVVPHDLCDLFIKFTTDNESNAKASYQALSKTINVLLDANVHQHSDDLWRLVYVYLHFPVTFSFSVTCAYLRSLKDIKLQKLLRAEKLIPYQPEHPPISSIIFSTIRYFLASPNDAVADAASEVGGAVGVLPAQVDPAPIYRVNEIHCVLSGVSYDYVFPLNYVIPRVHNPLHRKQVLIRYAIDSAHYVLLCHQSVLAGNATNTKVKALINAVRIISNASVDITHSSKTIYTNALNIVLQLLHCSLFVFHPQLILQSTALNATSRDDVVFSHFGEDMAEMYSMASHTEEHPTETLVDELLYCLAALIRRTGLRVVKEYIYEITTYLKLYHTDHLLPVISALDELAALSSAGTILENDYFSEINHIDCPLSRLRISNLTQKKTHCTNSKNEFQEIDLKSSKRKTTRTLKFIDTKIDKKESPCNIYTLSDLHSVCNQWSARSCADEIVWLETNLVTNMAIGNLINGFSLEYDERCILMNYVTKFCRAGFAIGPPDLTVSRRTNMFQHQNEETSNISYQMLYSTLFRQYLSDSTKVNGFKSIFQQMIPSHFILPTIPFLNVQRLETVTKFISYIRAINNYTPHFHSLSAALVADSATKLYTEALKQRNVKTFDCYDIDDVLSFGSSNNSTSLVPGYILYDAIHKNYEEQNVKVSNDANTMRLLLRGFYEAMCLLEKIANEEDSISRGIFRIHQELMWGSIANHDVFYLCDSVALKTIVGNLLNKTLDIVSRFPIMERPREYKRLLVVSSPYVDVFEHPALRFYASKYQMLNTTTDSTLLQKGTNSLSTPELVSHEDSIADSTTTSNVLRIRTIGDKYGIASTLENSVKEFTESCDVERSEMLRDLLVSEMQHKTFDVSLIDFEALTINSIDLIELYLTYGSPAPPLFYQNLSKIPTSYRSFHFIEIIMYHFTKYELDFTLLQSFLSFPLHSAFNQSNDGDGDASHMTSLSKYCEMMDLMYENTTTSTPSRYITTLLQPIKPETALSTYTSYFNTHSPFTRNDRYNGQASENVLFTPLYAQTTMEQYISGIIPTMVNILHSNYIRKLGTMQELKEKSLPFFRKNNYVTDISQLLQSEIWDFKKTPVASEVEALEALQCINTKIHFSTKTLEALINLILDELEPKQSGDLKDKSTKNISLERLLDVLVAFLIDPHAKHKRSQMYFFTYPMELNEMLVCSPFLITPNAFIPQLLSVPPTSPCIYRLAQFFAEKSVITTYSSYPTFYIIISLLGFYNSSAIYFHIVNNPDLKLSTSRRCLIDFFLVSTALYNTNLDISALINDPPICITAMATSLLFNPQALLTSLETNYPKTKPMFNIIFSHHFNIDKTPDFIPLLCKLQHSKESFPYPFTTVISLIVMLLRHSALSDNITFILNNVFHADHLLQRYREESNDSSVNFSDMSEDFISRSTNSMMKQLFDILCHPH